MRTLSRFISIACILLLGADFAPLHAAGKELGAEPFGKLFRGEPAKDLLTLLGKPEVLGKDTLWEALGQWVQEWKFPTRGLTINMVSDKKGGPKTILSITATGASKLATARGIHIGSTEAEVGKAYKDVYDKADSVTGSLYVAGSIYDGILFTIKDGKVSQIFLGAGAE